MKLVDIFWNRIPHSLARDSDGRYYYVDRLAGQDQSYGYRGFRVFVGMRGQMKRMKMKNVVSDPSGEIFITTKGKLKLILENKGNIKDSKVFWVSGKETTELTKVDVGLIKTRVMIYRQLGVYLGQPLHLPCDDL